MPYQRKLSMALRRRMVEERNTPCPCCGRLPLLKELAHKYGVTVTTVGNVVNGRGWYGDR